MENANGMIKNYLGILINCGDVLLIKSPYKDRVLKEINLKGVKVVQCDTVCLTNEDL